MAYKNPEEAFNDPDFRSSKPETQRWALRQIDPKGWGSKPDSEIDAFLGRVKPAWEREDKKATIIHQQVSQLPAPEPPKPKKSLYQRAVEPITEAVGQTMEMATEPLVPLARMLQGESLGAALSPESFQTVGAGGRAKETRQAAAAGVVPQSPWQAGAIGAQFVPGVGAAGPLARIGAAGLGAGGLQGLLGTRGAVEGGTAGEVASEAGIGALKGAGMQAVGEGLGKLVGAARRLPLTGAERRTARAEVKPVLRAVEGISPELKPAKRGMQAAGEFFTGTPAAREASSTAFKANLRNLEGELVKTQGHPFINAPELHAAYRKLAQLARREPVIAKQIAELAPTSQGFLPEQAATIVAQTGQRLKSGQSAVGHMRDQAMDDLVNAIEGSLPANAQGLLTAARTSYARSSGLQELLGGAFKPGAKGYQFDIRKLQEALSKDPDLLNRLGKSQLEQLLYAATRGASKQPGFADVPGGSAAMLYPSAKIAMVAAIRDLLKRGTTIGKHPLSLAPGTKAGLGVATTAASSVTNRATRKEE